MKYNHYALPLLFFFSVCVLHANGAEDEKPGDANSAKQPSPPQKVIEDAANHWKLRNLSERLRDPGAAGIQDVFWEIVQLCENDAKARSDADLQALMQWLLFDAKLSEHPIIVEPAFAKVPRLMPNIGAQLLEKRLSNWMAGLGTKAPEWVARGANEVAPWCWPEFRQIDAKMLASAVRQTMETGPSHHPIARLWLAAALLATDEQDGAKELSAARAFVEKNYTIQSGQVYAQVVASLADAGVKQALPLLLEQAEQQDTAAPQPDENRQLAPLAHVLQLLGWQPAQTPFGQGQQAQKRTDTKAEIAKLRDWLKTNGDSLVWDARLRRYVSDAPPPGLEELYQYGKALEKKYQFKCLEQIAQANRDSRELVSNLVALMEKNSEAAKDPDAGQFLLALADQRANPGFGYDDKSLLLAVVPKLNRDLGVKLWANTLRRALAGGEGLENLLQSVEAEPGLVGAGCAALLPEFQKSYDEARKAEKAEDALLAAAQLLFAGGKPDRKQVAALLDKAPAAWLSGGINGKWLRWTNTLFNTHRTGYLRALLINASRDLANYRNKDRSGHPLGQFQYICGWTEFNNGLPGTGEEMLAKCEAWLEQNESKLVWDSRKNRFVGALSPDKAECEQLLAPLARYGIEAKEFLDAPDSAAHDGANKLYDSLLALGEKNAEAAKDPALSRALTSLCALLPAQSRDSVTGKLLVALPRIDRAAGVKLWAATIKKNVDAVKSNPIGGSLENKSRIPGADPAVIQEARTVLAAEYKKLAETPEAATPLERSTNALACLYFGGTIELSKLEKLLSEDLPHVTMWGTWAVSLAQTGKTIGLHIFLLIAKIAPDQSQAALPKFEAMTGLLRQTFPADMAARFAAYQEWLNQHEKELQWNPQMQHYILPGQPGLEGGPAQPPRPPVKATDEF